MSTDRGGGADEMSLVDRQAMLQHESHSRIMPALFLENFAAARAGSLVWLRIENGQYCTILVQHNARFNHHDDQ